MRTPTAMLTAQNSLRCILFGLRLGLRMLRYGCEGFLHAVFDFGFKIGNNMYFLTAFFTVKPAFRQFCSTFLTLHTVSSWLIFL